MKNSLYRVGRQFLLTLGFLGALGYCRLTHAHCGSHLCASKTAEEHAAPPAEASGIEDVSFVPGSYTFVVVPDTQKYTNINANNDEFDTMMDWIVGNKATRNIQLMLHEGDITNNNNTHDWAVAKGAISRLDEETPYVLSQGNHDVSNSASRNTLMNSYFNLAGAISKSHGWEHAWALLFETCLKKNHLSNANQT